MTNSNELISRINLGKTIIHNFEDKFNLPIRLFGSIAIALKCPKNIFLWTTHKRIGNHKDLDLIIEKNSISEDKLITFMESLNCLKHSYYDERKLNTGRMVFVSPDISFEIEIHSTPIKFCREFSFNSLISIDEYTLCLTDLTILKFQIHDIEQKDFLDLAILFIEHSFGNNECCSISIRKIYNEAKKDWILKKIIENNLKKFKIFSQETFKSENDKLDKILAGINKINCELIKIKFSNFHRLHSLFNPLLTVENPTNDHTQKLNF